MFGKSFAVTAMLLSVALPGVALAQSGDITGRVTDVFAGQFVLESDGQRLLVTPGEGVDMPPAGSTVAVTGARNGREVNAEAIRAQTAAPAAPAAQDDSLPEALRGLNLTDIRDHANDDDERRISARLPDGSEMRIEYNRDGTLDEVEADRNAALPGELLRRILPPALLESEEFRAAERVTEVEFDTDDNEVQVDGRAADGAKIELTAGSDGRIFSFERELDQDARRAMADGDARERLAALGYSSVDGGKEDDGSRTFTATNPQGERVAVRLDDQGRVTREEALR